MKLTCQRPQLASAFQTVSAIVPARTPKPILQNIKLEASTTGGVALTGTDAEVAIRYRLLDAQVQTGGALLLPKQKTADILREMQGETITIDAKDNKLIIKGERSEYKLGTEDPAEFPPVAEFEAPNYYILQAGTLRQMIRRTLFACDLESTRYALGGVLVDLKKDTATFAATDTRRLAIASGSVAMQGTVESKNATPVVPARAMSLIERSLTQENQPVWVVIDSHSVLLKSEQTTIYSRLVEGRFPRYQEVVPKSSQKMVDLVAGPFHAAVRQSQIVTSEESRGVVFQFTKGLLTLISHAAEIGESTVELPIAYDGDELKIEFDPRYVADFLKVLDAETPVRLEMNDAESAALFKTQDGYQYIVMPLSRDK